MRKALMIVIFTCVSAIVLAQVNIIKTIAGCGINGYGGDDSLATNARLYFPSSLCLDKFNNLYFTDDFNNRVRRVNLSTGIVTTIAGSGKKGYSGDGEVATNAELFIPDAIALDKLGNLYIADGKNNVIRKVDVSTNKISTVIGTGMVGDEGDGGLAIIAALNGPSGLSIDRFNNIYFADYYNNKIRRVSASTGIITTVAGNGTTGGSGDGGLAVNASLSGPARIFIDSLENIFISDQWNHRVRKVTAITGIISTVAGNGTPGYSGDTDPATKAQLFQPAGIYIDKQGNLFISEYGNGTVRKVDGTTGIITTVAGNGVFGYAGDGGPATNAEMKCSDVIVDRYGTMYIADMDNHRIRMVYDTTLNVGVQHELERINISMYPNPAQNEVIIEGAKGCELKLYNMLGQEVYMAIVLQDKDEIDLRMLAAGTYMVQVKDAAGVKITRRIVKE